MKKSYSVSEINKYIKGMFAFDPLLENVNVSGEVSNCKYHGSGHIYFTLKDREQSLKAVMFKGYRNGLKFRLSDGQRVIVSGNIDVYERDGTYQLYAKKIVSDGTGVLFEEYEKLKRALFEEGMFDEMYKKPIPKFASRIGIVTAPSGAALQDIINITKRRNPHVSLVLCPAIVQGESAPESIISGIRRLDRAGVDVIICGRGGGSIEDLWAFNSEDVARAIFSCETPVISAVGHETDYTIADFVADLRAPTPSAAAELAVFSYDDFKETLALKKKMLKERSLKTVSLKKQTASGYARDLKYLDPVYKIEQRKKELFDTQEALGREVLRTLRKEKRRSLDAGEKLILLAGRPLKRDEERVLRIRERLRAQANASLAREKNSFALKCERLNALSPVKRLGGGYAFVSLKSGKNVRSIDDVKKDDRINVTLSDGRFEAGVIGTEDFRNEK